jgi:hypothetical protein
MKPIGSPCVGLLRSALTNLINAAPGAGKTIAACFMANRLIELGDIKAAEQGYAPAEA